MVSLAKYALFSTTAFFSVIIYVFYAREQFYPAMVLLSTSKICIFTLGNMFLMLLILICSLVQKLFLGTLREAEVERLYELSRHELMETCLAMTIFREEFDFYFAAMFGVLMSMKVLHWLYQKRVEYIETTPSVSIISHFRIFSLMILMFSLDTIFVRHSILHLTKHQVPSVHLLFAFEYVILASSTLVTMIKYSLYTADMIMDGQWDNKAVYIFYIELFRDLLHLSAYVVFFLIVFKYYGLPLHLMRDLYETFRNFRARVTDFIRYRRITSNLNDRFPDATPDDLARSDSTCIICREEMTSGKKLPCGHIFHVHCLRSWLERQQTCPTCRTSLIEANPNENADANNQQQQPQAEIAPGNLNFVAQRFFGVQRNQNQNAQFFPNPQYWANGYQPNVHLMYPGINPNLPNANLPNPNSPNLNLNRSQISDLIHQHILYHQSQVLHLMRVHNMYNALYFNNLNLQQQNLHQNLSQNHQYTSNFNHFQQLLSQHMNLNLQHMNSFLHAQGVNPLPSSQTPSTSSTSSASAPSTSAPAPPLFPSSSSIPAPFVGPSSSDARNPPPLNLFSLPHMRQAGQFPAPLNPSDAQPPDASNSSVPASSDIAAPSVPTASDHSGTSGISSSGFGSTSEVGSVPNRDEVRIPQDFEGGDHPRSTARQDLSSASPSTRRDNDS